MCRGGSGALGAAWPLLLLLLLLASACGEPVATQQPTFLQATGSMAMSPLVAQLTTAFGEQSPMTQIDVAGLGTRAGIASLQSGQTDVAMASWLPPDLDANWRSTAVARDAVAIIVHPTNPLAELGVLQLRDMYGGRVYEWQAVGGKPEQGRLQAVSREDGSGTRAAFESLVMEDLQVTPQAVMVPSSEAMVAYVAENPNAVGYVSMGFVSPEVKALKIEGAWPSAENAESGTYLLTREFWLVTSASPSLAVQEFLDYVLSPAGQQIVGYRHGRVR